MRRPRHGHRGRRDLIGWLGTRVILGLTLVGASVALMLGMGRIAEQRDAAEARAITAEQTRDATAQERDVTAQDLRDVAGAQIALCSTDGAAARALDAGGLCGQARRVLTNPVVLRHATALTPAQTDEIISRVRAATPARPSDGRAGD